MQLSILLSGSPVHWVLKAPVALVYTLVLVWVLTQNEMGRPQVLFQVVVLSISCLLSTVVVHVGGCIHGVLDVLLSNLDVGSLELHLVLSGLFPQSIFLIVVNLGCCHHGSSLASEMEMMLSQVFLFIARPKKIVSKYCLYIVALASFTPLKSTNLDWAVVSYIGGC